MLKRSSQSKGISNAYKHLHGGTWTEKSDQAKETLAKTSRPGDAVSKTAC